MIDGCVSMLLTVPVCSFRKGYAREFFETEEVPPPSTIYGFLLSLIGEEDRFSYTGAQLAYALLSDPELSIVVRTVWRQKNKESPPGIGNNRRPDYQEILTGLKLAIWMAPGPLADKLRRASRQPEEILRYGGLSLGESRDLVNDIIWFPSFQQAKAEWVVGDPKGNLPLPIWVDHVGSKGTIWRQFRLSTMSLETPPVDDSRWITISSST